MDRLSFWEKETFGRSYDLIVVGAGIVGLSSALFYKKRHPSARVAVLERGRYPRGASTRNAGFACIGSIGEHVADMAKETENNIKRRIVSRYNGLVLLKQTLVEAAIGYEDCGGYEFFKSEETFKEAADHIEKFNAWMEELLNEKSVYRPESMEGYPVIYNRLEGALHPGKMMEQLIQQVMQAGVEIRWDCPVQQADDGMVTVAEGDALEASSILLAVNGFARQLLPEVKVTPARGLILVTNEQDELPWKGTFHYDRGYIYFRNIGSRLLIGGARNVASDEEATNRFGINEKIKEQLTHFVSDVLKLPDSWSVEHQWSGIMGFTSTKTPVVKKVDDCCYVAAGLSGMGIAIGMDVGRQAAELLKK